MKFNSNTLSILGCICVVIASCYIYRAAKTNNRKAVKWILANLAVGLLFQLILPLLIVVTIVIITITFKGSNKDIVKIYAKYGLIVDILFLILNLVGIGLVIHRVRKSPESKVSAVPPPPNFDENKF